MPTLTAHEVANLKIDRFIFHVVHHGEPEPILLDQTPIGAFEPFFVARLVETLKGNRFVFTAGSLTKQNLVDERADPARFVEFSKLLARQFHAHGDQRIKRGVLIVMALRTGQRLLHSLIKYDHEKVISFDVNQAQAILRDVVNSFTESPNALQKSALVELNDHGGDLVVIDRNKRAGITSFFQNFLGVQRRHTETEMTNEAMAAVIKTVQKHVAELPNEITFRVKPRIVEIAQRRLAFDAEQFFSDFFGVHGTDAVRETFSLQLESRSLSGEAFNFDQAALPKAGPRKYRTNEGIVFSVPEQAADTFKVETTADGTSIVTIRTQRLVEQ